MATDRNSYSEVWEQLDAKWAERVRVTDASMLGDEEIVRRWPQIGEGYLSKCMEALSLFTDAKNTKPQLWVKDPVVGRETFPGTYRLVSVEVDTQKPGLRGIIEILRKGFATTAKWTEARIVAKRAALSNTEAVAGIANTTSDTVDREMEVLFPNCDPSSIEAIAESLRTADYSSGVTVSGETHSGAWHVISVSIKRDDDGSASAILRIATPQYTINSYEDYGTDRAQDIHYVMDVPKDLVQGIVDAWKTAHPVGSSATVTYSRDQKLVDVILRTASVTEAEFALGAMAVDCRSGDTETIWLNCATATLHPIPTVTADAGVSYVRRANRNPNGTWDISLKTITAKYRNIENLSAEVSGERTVTQQQQLGLTNQLPASMAAEAGKIKTQRVEVRDDCSRDIVTTSDAGIAQTNTAKRMTATETETVTSKTVQDAAEVLPTTFTAGTITRVENRPSKYPSKYDTVVQTASSVASDSGWIDFVEKNGTSYIRIFRNQKLAWITNIIAEFEDTRQNSVSLSLNEFGLYDGTAHQNAVRSSGGGLYTPPDDASIDYTITVDGVDYAVSIKVTSSQSTAAAHVHNVEMKNGAKIGVVPGIRYLGHGMWKATKVT